jgi:hypothetical protein
MLFLSENLRGCLTELLLFFQNGGLGDNLVNTLILTIVKGEVTSGHCGRIAPSLRRDLCSCLLGDVRLGSVSSTWNHAIRVLKLDWASDFTTVPFEARTSVGTV